MDETTGSHPAGFWVRFAAFSIDGLLVYLATMLVAAMARWSDRYVSFELTALALMGAYSTALHAWRGKTVGKAACGIMVSSGGNPPSLWRSAARELIGKPLSASIMLGGFWWVGISRRKRGLHDRLAGTTVIRSRPARRLARLGMSFGLVTSGLIAGGQASGILAPYIAAGHMRVPAGAPSRYADREPGSLGSVSALTEDDYADLVGWLDEHGTDPTTFAVETAARHQVTLFGERHGIRENLDFFNRIIPRLHEQAGVTCIALETCPATSNEALRRLVTASDFDRDLALRIARGEGWRRHGYEEYWEVLETVWRVNRTIPEGKKKLRVIGLEVDADMPSFALLGLGDDGLRNAPLWERLRILRLLDDIARLSMRDELMAMRVEKEIIDREERGIVWIGANHSYLHYGQSSGGLGREFRRMGYMLHHKYRDRIAQIVLHVSPLERFMEKIMARRGNRPVGFDVEGSPLGSLGAGLPAQPGVSLADLASGYIFLGAAQDLHHSRRIAGFISEEMFLSHKPYYEAIAQRPLKDAREANLHVSNRSR